MTQNSDEFLDAFSAIEKWLKRQAGGERHTPFFQLVDQVSFKSKIIRRYKDDLKEFGDLRNAIVHERTDCHVIAEPNVRAVSDIKRIEKAILNPPLVVPMFQLVVRTRRECESVGKAVTDMRSGSFSQLPILSNDNKLVAVLTAETVARWLASEFSNDLVSLLDTKIEKVIPHAEDTDHYCILSRSSTLFDALSRFEEFASRGKDLDAAIITEGGKSEQRLLGIITVYDLPRILSEIGLRGISAV